MTAGGSLSLTSGLLDAVFPGTNVADIEYLRWLYLGSPFGSVIETNLDDDLGRRGHYALVPIVLSTGGQSHQGALSLNTAIAERARGGGMFVKLASAALEKAAALGVETVIGVANANSTPGFLRRLNFDLVTSLPATVMLPLPGRRRWQSMPATEATSWLTESTNILSSPSGGLAREWTPETLAWRLSCPGRNYWLHRGRDGLAVSIAAHQGAIPVAVLLKVFAANRLNSHSIQGLVRSAAAAHRAPIVLHVGLNDLFEPPGLPLPNRLKPSPLNLIRRDLSGSAPAAPITRLEFLDFDAY